MTFQLPIRIEQATVGDQQLAALGICPRCAPFDPPLGRPRKTLELNYSGAGYDWHQCTRCLRVFVTEHRRKP